MKKKIMQYPASYIVFGFFLIITYLLIIPLAYFNIFQNLEISNNFWALNFINIGKDILICFLLILIFHKSLKREMIDFWKNKKELTKIGFSAWGKGLLLMILSNIIIVAITKGMAGNEEQNREIMQQLPIYSIFAMCFMGPFIEEVVFRKSFKKAFKSKTTFVIFTSFVFASLHVINGFDNLSIQNILNNWQQLLYFIPYTSLAIFFADAYYKTDNIFTSTFAHCLHNTFSVIIILLGNMIL